MSTDRSTSARLRGLAINAACVIVSLVAVSFLIPSAFGLQRYVIAGGSMSGSIELGSVVFEEVVPVEDLRVGDVITYVPPAESGIENLVTHRIASIDADTYRTKGDANADVDPWTFQLTAATQPRVVFDVPYVGHLFLALADRGTRIALIGIPAGLIFLLALVELIGATRRPREKAVEELAPVPPGPVVKVLTMPAQPAEAEAGAVRAPRRGRRVLTATARDKITEKAPR